MKESLTAYQLAELAARLGTTLSPADAVEHALRIYEAADALVRADEIALEKQTEQLRQIAENLDEWIPVGSRMTIPKALEYLSARPAGKRLKSERGLLDALRKKSLAFETNGVWTTSPKLLEEFRQLRVQAERDRKKGASKKKMSGSPHLSKRKLEALKRNAPAEVRKSKTRKRKL